MRMAAIAPATDPLAMITRRHLFFLGAAAVSVSGVVGRAAVAQAWPARFVRLIVPFAPGGAADAITYSVTGRLSDTWRQQVVIEHKSGAGTNIGA